MAETKHSYLAFGDDRTDTYRKLGDQLGKAANRDQFLLAMCWGFRSNTRVEKFKHSGNGVRVDYLKDEDNALIAAVHLAVTGTPESLADVDEGYSIAEQFAEGGILLLGQMMEEPGGFSRKLAGEVKAELDKLNLDDR